MKLIITLTLSLFLLVSCQKEDIKTAEKQENLLDSIQPSQEFDAPFVYSKGDSIYLKRVLKSSTGPGLITKTFSKPKNSELEFTVFINHIDKSYKDFKVKVKPNAVFDTKDHWTTEEKILVVSDYEGEFFHFVDFLISAQVIDENYNWKFGKNHLVFNGDVFDRGTMVHECIWLLYKLESEGANIHFLYGNHEIMNISGNQTNYVPKKYKEVLSPLGLKNIEDLYKPNTVLGSWLRIQNVMEKANDILLVHGGVSDALFDSQPNLSISKANEIVKRNLDDPKNPEAAPYLRSNDALTWFRGYFRGTKQTQEKLESILKHFDTNVVCVGHNVQKNVGFFYNGKVVCVDVNVHKGQKEGLLIDKKNFYRLEVKDKNSPAVKTKL